MSQLDRSALKAFTAAGSSICIKLNSASRYDSDEIWDESFEQAIQPLIVVNREKNMVSFAKMKH